MNNIKTDSREDTKGIVRAAETVLEVLILTFLYYLVWKNAYPEGLFPGYSFKGKYVLTGVYAVIICIFFRNAECTLFGQLKRMDLILGQMIALFLVNFVTYFQLCLIANRMVSAIPVVLLYGLQLGAAMALIDVYCRIYYRLYAPHDMVMIYGSKSALGLKLKMDSRRDKYNITRLISAETGLEEICRELKNHDSVVLNDVPAQLRNDVLKFCYENRIRTYVVPKLTDIMLRGGEGNTLFDTPLLLVKGTGLTPVQRAAKRTLDILLCLVALIPALPVMAVIAAAIKLEDGGPVLFRQNRLTRGGAEFTMLKFRSMIVNAEACSGAVLASDADPRITKVGRVLRKYRLDELPQICNILKGDMSIVGPRPERRILAEHYSGEIPEFSYRLKVRGGLTGYAQIYGKYNTSPYDKLRLDLIYVENYSLRLDIKLIILTLRTMLSRESTEGIDKAQQHSQKVEDLFGEQDSETTIGGGSR